MLWFCHLIAPAWAATPTTRVLEHTETLLAMGPRAHGQPGELRALQWVDERLREQGYETQLVGEPGVLTACTGGPAGEGAIWLLAHLDAVHPAVPGAVDNAVGVAALLVLGQDMARVPPPSQVCLGFPRAEELGLVGSRAWVRQAPPPTPALVVALDLVGQGQLSATGLGPMWGDTALSWLAELPDVEQPVAYRVVSRQLGIERSDHAPFAQAGVLSMHLLGRGRSGVFWAYHSPRDDLAQVEPQAVAQLMRTLERITQSRPLPLPSSEDAVTLPWLRVVLPGGLVWLLWVAGVGAAPLAWRGWRAGLMALVVSVVGTGVGGLAWSLGGFGRVQSAALAAPLTLAWALGLLAVTWAWPRQAQTGRGAALAFGVLALAAGLFDPIMGLWLSLGALALALGGFRPLVGLAGLALPLYICAPSTWRELVFHGLVPDNGLWWMPARALVCWPLVALGLGVPRWRWGPVILVALCGLVVGATLAIPAYSAAFPLLERP